MNALAVAICALPEAERRAALASCTPEELAALEYEWPVWARHDQLPPAGEWRIWALIAGRGAGKTRSAAEWVRSNVETGRRRSIGVIGPTADTLRRDVVQGESGLLQTAPPWNRPTHEPSQRRVVWPNGAVAHLLSSEEPDRIRGVNLDGFWGDEVTSWNEPMACYDNLQFALRIRGPLGDAPAGVISTTPKRHTLLKMILADSATVVTRATTYDNAANLDAATLDFFKRRYEGSTLGRQELLAEVLEDLDGALWTRALLDACRVPRVLCDLRRVVVGVDPSGGSNKGNAETGIITAGYGTDGHIYVTGDSSGRYSPDAWGRKAVDAYRAAQADRIVCETNFGGDMVIATIRAVDKQVSVKAVNASRGKAVRAEPIVALYEQRKVHHLGEFPALEDQLCGWDPMAAGPSPDRLDALVWAITELSSGHAPMRISQAAVASAPMRRPQDPLRMLPTFSFH